MKPPRGEDRIYRLFGITGVHVLADESGHRIDTADELAERWQDRRADFRRSRPPVRVLVRTDAGTAGRLAAGGLRVEGAPGTGGHGGQEGDGTWVVEFWDRAHAAGVLWSLGPAVEVLEPADVRTEVRDRAADTLTRYGPDPEPTAADR